LSAPAGRRAPPVPPAPSDLDPGRRGLLALAGFIAGCLAIAGLGGAVTSLSVGGWYQGLIKPPFNPPDQVFAPVWTILFLMMAIAAWRVWRHRESPGRGRALVLFASQLALNLLWSCLFFGFTAVGAALAELVGERRERPMLRANIGIAMAEQGDREEAQRYLTDTFELCKPGDMGWTGLQVLGAIAIVTDDAERRRWALDLGEDIVSGPCNGQGRYRFFRDAAEAALRARDWKRAERFADALEAVTCEEPLPWSHFYADCARAIVAVGLGGDRGASREALETLRDLPITPEKVVRAMAEGDWPRMNCATSRNSKCLSAERSSKPL